jgi:hypothetical protein
MLSLSFSWRPSSSFLNCYSAGAGHSGWCLHTHTYHNAVVAMLIIEVFFAAPPSPTSNPAICRLQIAINQGIHHPHSNCHLPERLPLSPILSSRQAPLRQSSSILEIKGKVRPMGRVEDRLSNPCIWALLALCVKSPRFLWHNLLLLWCGSGDWL